MEPKVGDKVLHHGRIHEIIGFREEGARRVGGKWVPNMKVFFRNGRYLPKADASELKWSAEDEAWYLPGRVLSKDERTVINAMMGAWPNEGSHMAVRKILDVEGPLADHVSLERLGAIIKARRLRRGYDLKAQKTLDGRVLTTAMSPKEIDEILTSVETEEAFEERVRAYAIACIEHVEELRAYRRGEKEDVPLPPNDGSAEAVKVRRIPGGGPYNVREI
ncbi:MAG: hypothetical protein ACWGQW_14895 [bacterium]